MLKPRKLLNKKACKGPGYSEKKPAKFKRDGPCLNAAQDVLDAGELAKLAFYNDIVVGAVCCRVDTANTGKKVGRDRKY